MIKHTLLISLRNIRKHTSSFLINLTGLTSGLAFAFLLYLWISDEKSIDKFHENDERLYQVMERSKENGIIRIQDGTQGPLSEALEQNIPEIEQAITVMNVSKEGIDITLSNDDNKFKAETLFAGKTFFQAFTFPFIHGSPGGALVDKNSIVISEELANKLFGTSNAIGKTISWSIFGKEHISSITGVFNTVGNNSTLRFDAVFTKQKLIEDIWPNGTKWYNTGPETYLLLKKDADVAVVNKKIERFLDQYDKGNIFSLFIRKYSDGYLYGNYENGEQVGGRITNVTLFTAIAIMLLVIAAINFMNLSTAKVSGRLKEISIKKTVGIARRQLIYQFLGESLFITAFSALLAIGLAALLMPQFNFITGKQLSFHFTFSQLAALMLIALFTGLLSGSYPAFYLSGFTPLATLKGKIPGKAGEFLIRKGLVVFQFTISLVLIVSVLIVYKQIRYAQNKSIGYDKDQVVYFDLEGSVFKSKENFFNQLRQLPGIVDAAGTDQSLIREDGGSSTYGLSWAGKDENRHIDFVIRSSDKHLVQTLGIQMKEGKPFSETVGDNNAYLLLNETAANLMGLKNPVGTKVNLWGEDKTILGVMKDFHTASVHQTIAPFIFHYVPDNSSIAMIRIKAGDERETIKTITDFYTSVNPGYGLNLQFLDDTFRAQYITEEQTLALAKYFAVLTILISCLGLFGLAAFETERRTKEIGIRKVLGAKTVSIVSLLSKDFLVLVTVAIVIATPIAYLLMLKWLDAFTFKIDIGWSVFIAAGVAAIVVALITVSSQAIKAAIANPIKSLRSE